MINHLRLHLENISFSHTLFALPFLVLGYLIPVLSQDTHTSGFSFLFLLLAAICARSYAMAINRLVDLPFDRLNSRTANRPLARGALSIRSVRRFTELTLVGFILCALPLGQKVILLLPIPLFFLSAYSFLKRFTWFSHFWLAATLAQAPLAGWLVAANRLQPTAWLLSSGVFFWVSGFDILYAIEDRAFDREVGLYSLPNSLGITRSRLAAVLLHLYALFLFGAFTYILSASDVKWIGWFCLACTVAAEHVAVITPSRFHARFGLYNGLGSLAYATFLVAALVQRF